ncbi:MAG: MgtC/SapB family protein [Eubacteriales bacterium]|nr:MgtC/SapB family protein [Eubacteriales bacterium]
MEQIAVLRELTLPSILLRIFLAMLFSGILGYERERKGRPAGFRTYMVVCLGSAIAMMTGIYLNQGTGAGDPGRIAAQVISGIGFLGAGTILVTRQNQVKGLTTAAGLWADACLGLALGAGFYSGGIIVFGALWCSLRILQVVDWRLSQSSRVFSIYVEFSRIRDLSAFLSYGRTMDCSMDGLEVTRSKDISGGKVVAATMTLHFTKPTPHAKVIEDFGRLEGVQFIKEV